MACDVRDICRDALPDIARSYWQARRAEFAPQFFSRVIEMYPDLEAAARQYRGVFLEKTGALVEARDDYERAVELAPSDRLHLLLGDVHVRLEDWRAAVEVYRAGLRVDPGDVRLRYKLARAYWALGEIQRAEDLLEAIVDERPDHSPSLVNLGRIRLSRGERSEAVRMFERAAALDPTNVESRFMMARLAVREGGTVDAERWLREVHRAEGTPTRARSRSAR